MVGVGEERIAIVLVIRVSEGDWCIMPHGRVGRSRWNSVASAQRWWGKGVVGKEGEDHRNIRASSLWIIGGGYRVEVSRERRRVVRREV